MSLAIRVSEELLPFVEKPAQYIGGEWNQLVGPEDWDRAAVRVAIAFPDTYAIGMSHLGCQILYWICNHLPGVCAERVYAPWVDAERRMRACGLPLFTWDTRRPVSEADILAFSVQYELVFSNLLLMLDLAGIPFRAAERSESDPLVIAGGAQVDNPEPIADFLDLVVVGDGEHSMPALVGLVGEMKAGGARRREIIAEAARRFPWVYAPALYEVRYAPDGTIRAFGPAGTAGAEPGPPVRIERCRTPDFETAAVPLRPLVPFAEIVHDRIGIEIMRGCPQRCRFCHAGQTRRPLVLRSVERILQIAEESWRHTGYDEIGLLSLSTADYPHLEELAARLNERFAGRKVNLSVPSLRVDRMLSAIPWMVSGVRKGGLTIAAEAARPHLRQAIRKKVTDGDLMEGLKEAYRAGWNAVKIYFMCGFPGERDEDIAGIFDLAREVSLLKRSVRGGPAAVTASVGWLVPKPHTPLQWAAQATAEYFEHARRLLRQRASQVRSAVRIRTHRPERSILEGVFARGDRRLAPVIEAAYRLGARMDGWDEVFDPAIWRRAFEETGVDPAFYAHRERRRDEVLPWDHIAGPFPRVHLEHEYDDLLTCAGMSG